MKTLILALLILFCTSLTTYAEKNEWYDNSYDFTKPKSIVFRLWVPEGYSDLVAREIGDIYYEQIKTEIYDKLNTKCKIVSYKKLLNNYFRDNNITEQEFNDLMAKNPEKMNSLVDKYIEDNYDLCVLGRPLVYDMGTQYCEGYIYSMPSYNTSVIHLPNGQVATASSTGQTIHSVPGGNFPTVYVCFRFDVTKAKTLTSTGDNVWTRIDDRARVNRDVFQNSKPKDVFKRIMNSFCQDFVKAMNTRKATKSAVKSNDYGF